MHLSAKGKKQEERKSNKMESSRKPDATTLSDRKSSKLNLNLDSNILYGSNSKHQNLTVLRDSENFDL